MAIAYKIDSNIVGCRYALEDSSKVLPRDPVWNPLKVNSFSDFGAQITTITRNPLDPGRQREKGVISDLDASGGFSIDLTQDNLQDLLQGVMFADARQQIMIDGSVSVSGNAKQYRFAGNLASIKPSMILHVKGFANPVNNGMKTVTAVGGGGITVAEALVDEGNTPATLQVVGITLGSGVASIKGGGGGVLPTLTISAGDFTTLFNFVPGTWVYVGGDAATAAFASDVNNGYKRVRSMTSTVMTFDKFDRTMVDDAGAGKSIQLFFGKVIKNEVGTRVRTRTYQIERTLGAPDTSKPTELQSEYLVGALANEFTLNVPLAEKITADMTFIGADAEQRLAADGLKAGTRPEIRSATAFNTSSDFRRIKLAEVVGDGAFVTPLFTYITSLTLNINNNVTPLKAIGVLGAFDTTAGMFEVSGSMEAYFADMRALKVVRANTDMTLDVVMAKENAGIVIDIPLLTLGNAQVQVESDAAIQLPLEFNGAKADKLDPVLDYTILMVFYDYLPDRAAAGIGAP